MANELDQYYADYVKYATSAGLPAMSKEAYYQGYTGKYATRENGQPAERYNYDAGYRSALNEILQNVKQNYAEWNARYKAAGGAEQIYTGPGSVTSNDDISAAIGLFNTLKQSTINKEKENEDTAKLEKTKQEELAKAEELAKPSSELLAIQNKIQSIIDNPETVDPAKVQSWTTWLNTVNEAEDRKAAQRLTQQFAALGDIGSSAQRSAMTELTATTQLGRQAAGLGLAQDELTQKTSQVSDALTRLLTIEGIKTQNATIPLQMAWSDYVNKQNQGFTASQNLANQQFTERQTAMSLAEQARQNRELMALYKASQPKPAEWWQPLLNVGLTAAGFGLTGGVASLLGIGKAVKAGADILTPTATPTLVKVVP